MPVVAIGRGEPYALAPSAYWVELYSPDELRFTVGRELALVAAGHAKITSLMSASGRDNPLVSVAFGAGLRTIEYTADRVGLLCCGSLSTATSAMAISAFQHVGRRDACANRGAARGNASRVRRAAPTIRHQESRNGSPTISRTSCKP